MNTFNTETIKTLKSFNLEDWYGFLDNCFSFKVLPKSLSISYEFTSEYFVELNNFISSVEEFDLLDSMHSNLILYYFDLPYRQDSFSKIYTLHWVFANIKIRVKNEEFYHQLFKEDLNNVYYNKIHLHSSLLSLICHLPNLKSFDASTYLFSSIDRVNDFSFFRVALRYLIENNSINDYLNYFDKISNKSNDINFAIMLTESLMDLRDYYGSFQQFYDVIDDFWIEYSLNHKVFSEIITDTFNKKYLQIGKRWFDNDPYAKMLKAFINSSENPPPVTLIAEIFNDSINNSNIKRKQLIGGLSKIFKNKYNWKKAIIIDTNESNDWCFISNYPYNVDEESYYRTVYGIEKQDSFIENANSEFQSFITRNCDLNYEAIKKYDIRIKNKALEDA